jgi:ubiquinone/menaquinone biosynthesis C-methylase UbiE
MFYKGEKLKELMGSHLDLQGLGPHVKKVLTSRLPHDDVKVLDVGTGSAGNAEFLARFLSKKSRIWTLDPSPEVLAEARKTLAAKGLDSKIKFVRADASETGLQSGFFECVVSVMTLHHIEDLRPAVAEMVRVLKGDGKILLVDYKPEAAGKLHFAFRHAESDFFASSMVADILRSERAGVVAHDFDFWYLVEGTKSVAD